MHKSFSKIWIIVIFVAFIVVGVSIWQYWWTKEEKPEIPEGLILPKEGHPRLDSVLYQLTQTKNYTEFAQSSGLDIVNNKVRVIIELVNPEYTLPINFGTEEARYENLLQALVQIDKLIDLADDPNIKLIRRPYEPVSGEETANITTLSGKYSIIPNPCTTEPCLPGLVYAVVVNDKSYIPTINGIWFSSDNKLSWEGYVPSEGDQVMIKGYLNENIDKLGKLFYIIEISSLKKE